MQIFEMFGSILIRNDEANRNIQETEGIAKRTAGKLGGFFKGAGIAVAAGIAVGTAALGKVGIESVKAAASAEAMQAQFEQVFAGFESQATDMINSLSGDFGMLPNRIKPALSQMTSMFKGLGLETEEAADAAARGTTIAADAAAFYDVSFESANGSLNSFIKGNYEGGEAIGLFANETQLAAYAAEKGYGKFSDLGEAQKQLIRMEFAEEMQASAGATGQASREADGLENVMGNLKQSWQDFLAVVGEPVLALAIPILKGLTDLIVLSTDKVKLFMESIKAGDSIFSGFGDKIKGLMETFKTAFTKEGFSGIIGVFADLIPQIANTLIASMPTLLAKGQEMLSKLVEGITTNIPLLSNTIVTFIQTWISNIATFYPMILEAGVKILIGVIEGIVSAFPTIVSTITGLINTIVSAISTLLPMIIPAGVSLLTAVITGILSALPVLIGAIATLVTTLVGVISENLPLVIQAGISLIKAIIQGIVDNLPLLLNAVLELLTGLVQTILSNLPLVLQAGAEILQAIAAGLVSLVPVLIDTILSLVVTIVSTLIQNLPMIIKAGIELLLALIEGILSLLPMIVSTAITLIIELVGAIATMLPQLIAAGIEIIVALIEGIVGAIPLIIAAMPKIIGAIKDGFTNVDWLQMGVDIVMGIVGGILSIGNLITETIGGLITSAMGGLKKLFGIKSPSTKFRDEIGQWIPKGIAVGIEGEADAPLNAMKKINTDLTAEGVNLRTSMNKAPNKESGQTQGNTTTQNITVVSPKSTASEIARKFKIASRQLATE